MTRCDADRERGRTREREPFRSVAPSANGPRSGCGHLRVLLRFLAFSCKRASVIDSGISLPRRPVSTDTPAGCSPRSRPTYLAFLHRLAIARPAIASTAARPAQTARGEQRVRIASRNGAPEPGSNWYAACAIYHSLQTADLVPSTYLGAVAHASVRAVVQRDRRHPPGAICGSVRGALAERLHGCGCTSYHSNRWCTGCAGGRPLPKTSGLRHGRDSTDPRSNRV